MTKVQTISRPDHAWPEVWTKIGKAAQNREKQEWAKEKRKLDSARKLKGIYFIDPDDQDCKETLKCDEKIGTNIRDYAHSHLHAPTHIHTLSMTFAHAHRHTRAYAYLHINTQTRTISTRVCVFVCVFVRGNGAAALHARPKISQCKTMHARLPPSPWVVLLSPPLSILAVLLWVLLHSHPSLVWCCFLLLGGVGFSSLLIGGAALPPAPSSPLSVAWWCCHTLAPCGWCCFPSSSFWWCCLPPPPLAGAFSLSLSRFWRWCFE